MPTEIIRDISIRQREVTVAIPWDEVRFVLARRALEAVGLWDPEAEDGTGGATVNVAVALDDGVPDGVLRVRATVDITASIA